jgi:hypothetical protein
MMSGQYTSKICELIGEGNIVLCIFIPCSCIADVVICTGTGCCELVNPPKNKERIIDETIPPLPRPPVLANAMP